MKLKLILGSYICSNNFIEQEAKEVYIYTLHITFCKVAFTWPNSKESENKGSKEG